MSDFFKNERIKDEETIKFCMSILQYGYGDVSRALNALVEYEVCDR